MTIALEKQPTTSTFWSRLTAPHPSITSTETRRQSRLLAGLLITLFVTTLFADIILLAKASGSIPPTLFFTIPGQLFLLGLYFANRAGHYGISAALLVAQNFILIFAAAVGSSDTSWLLFASMALIFSAILMPVRVTSILFVSTIVLDIVLAATHPMATSMSVPGTLIVFLITSSMVLVFMNHRTGLERERQKELQTINTELLASQGALQQINATLEQRVSERTVQLEYAKEEAERANQVKSAFLASMSHELRTPLNAIINFTKFVANGDMGPVNQEQEETLGDVVTSSKHLLNLINDVLDMSKIEAGALSLFIEDDVDLKLILTNIESTGKVLVSGKPVTFSVDAEAGLPSIRADRQRILQILLNIVSNACKFTATGSVKVQARRSDENILISVQDTGPGIPVKDQSMVFEAFKQTESGLRQGGGTGLGMPISKNLTEAHNGKLWLESEPGKGTTFLLRLPIQSKDLIPMSSVTEPS